MKENYTVCNCIQVSYGDIVDALHEHENLTAIADRLASYDKKLIEQE